MLYYNSIREGIDLAKSSNIKEFSFTGFLIMDSNFKILYAMAVMIWQFYVLIKGILLLSALVI